MHTRPLITTYEDKGCQRLAVRRQREGIWKKTVCSNRERLQALATVGIPKPDLRRILQPPAKLFNRQKGFSPRKKGPKSNLTPGRSQVPDFLPAIVPP